MNRITEIKRATNETEIFIKLNLDGKGVTELDYPVGFMSHMLNTFAHHGLFDLVIHARGDLSVDQHHLVEDTGIVLGQCFAKALGDKRGIRRNGSCFFPMDETLARAAVDMSGRPFLYFDGQLTPTPMFAPHEAYQPTGDFQNDLIEDFWLGFVTSAGCNMHLEIIRGRSEHHKIEALFKAAARALRAACEYDDRARDSIPSTKGVLPGFDSSGVIV